MRRFKHSLLTTVAAMAFCAVAAGNANAYAIIAKTNNTGGISFDASQSTFGSFGGLTASFTYTGPLSFNVGPPQNNTSTGDLNSDFFAPGAISQYTSAGGTLQGPSNANFSTLTTFLASSGSAANYQYGSIYSVDLGVLTAGTVLTISHDDGISIYQGGTRIGSTASGPTSVTTDTIVIGSTADTFLYYARENGAPSVLSVAVPEPVSMALLGTGLVGLGLVQRRKRQAA